VVSVVVATRNRSHLLPRLCAALVGQRGVGPYEVVIVDDASTDDTWKRLEDLVTTSDLALRPLRLSGRSGPATARNAGWQAAEAPLVAFTDDDCQPATGWLASLVAGFEGADIVQGITMPDPAQEDRRGPFSRTLEVAEEDGYYQTCNIAYRRDLLEQLGGFHEGFRHPTGEDTDLAWRALEAGARTAFVEDALVHHDVRPSSFLVHLGDTWRWEGVVLAVRRHPGLRARFHRRWFWKPSHPPVLLAALGLAAASRPRTTPVRRLTALLLLLPYLWYRARVLPLPGGPRRRLAVIPLALLADLAEVGVLAIASARYRCLLL
jgi:GT2 family glycosyltransferase